MRLHLDSAVTQPGDARTNSVSGAGGGSSSRVQNSGSARDSVSISGTSSALGQIASDRAARIQALSSAVQSGTYQVSSSAIAGAILAHADA